MSLRYPVIINGIRFLVNPKHITVGKTLVYGTLPTEDSVQYQIWYEQPEQLEIGGSAAGETAYQELQFLNDTFARKRKVSELYYKNKIYKGFITTMRVTSSSDYIFRYKYSLTFQLLGNQTFKLQDLTIKKMNEVSLANRVANTFELISDDFRSSWDNLKTNVGVDTFRR